MFEVGAALSLAAPDAEHLYPGGSRDFRDSWDGPLFDLVPGFAYPVYDAKVEAKRVRLQARHSDVYRDWCALFTPRVALDAAPFGSSEVFYTCTGSSMTQQTVGESFCTSGQDPTPMDCGKLACIGLCACTSTRCEAADKDMDVQLDAALAEGGTQVQGTLLIDDVRISIRLTHH